MERETRKNENNEFKDLPEVKIDPEKESPFKKKLSKKISILIILVLLIVFVLMALYFVFESKQQPNKPQENQTQEETKSKSEDTTPPTFVGMQDRIVIEQNALDVDLTKYFLAIDEDKQAKIQVIGDVNLVAEGEYPIVVSGVDEEGNSVEHNVTVQVVSENTMSTGIELSCYIDGSIPLEAGTKQRLMANVIYFYYQDQNPEIQQKINELQIDVSQYPTQTTWHPSMQQTTPTV